MQKASPPYSPALGWPSRSWISTAVWQFTQGAQQKEAPTSPTTLQRLSDQKLATYLMCTVLTCRRCCISPGPPAWGARRGCRAWCSLAGSTAPRSCPAPRRCGKPGKARRTSRSSLYKHRIRNLISENVMKGNLCVMSSCFAVMNNLQKECLWCVW